MVTEKLFGLYPTTDQRALQLIFIANAKSYTSHWHAFEAYCGISQVYRF